MPLGSLINKLLRGEADEWCETDFGFYLESLTHGDKKELEQVLETVDEAIVNWKSFSFISHYEDKIKEWEEGKCSMDEVDELYFEEESWRKEGKRLLTAETLYAAISSRGFINDYHHDAMEKALDNNDVRYLKTDWENMVSAKEEEDLSEYSFEQVEKTLEKAKISFSYEELVKKLITGNIKGAFSMVRQSVGDQLFSILSENRNFMRQLIAVAIIAAVFKNFSDAFFQGNTGDTAFYVTYMILIGLMANSFFFLNSITDQVISTLIDFMKGLITAYSIAVVATTGVSTSVALYEMYLFVIYIISLLVQSVIFPAVKILFVLKIVNHISLEEKLSRLCDTLEWAVRALLKALLAVVLGIQMIQAMLLPAVDSVKDGIFKKGVSMIPGVGQGVSTVTTTLIGSAVVIKNSIGVAGIFVLCVIILVPLMQIGGILLSYIGTGILLQPVSDKRITGSLDAVIKSGKLLLRTVFTLSILFILSIAIVAFSTNINYYTG